VSEEATPPSASSEVSVLPPRKVRPNWRANVVASYVAAAVILAASVTTSPRFSPGEAAFAFLISPVTLPPTVVFTAVAAATGHRQAEPMIVVTPLVYLAVFIPLRSRYRRMVVGRSSADASQS
jgi:hypothetical protein